MTGVFRVGSHHLARELARLEWQVLHVSSPVHPLHILRSRDPVVRRRVRLALNGPDPDEDGVKHAVASSLIPQSLGFHGGPPAARRLRPGTMAVKRNLRAAGIRSPDLILVDQPLFARVAAAIPAGRVIYRPTDAHPSGPMAVAERDLLSYCDGIVATSDATLQSLGSQALEIPSLVLENGVELERFPHSATLGEGVVYVGAIDHRFDWETVMLLAARRPHVTFKLAGPVTAAPPAGLPSNVQLLGPVPYGELATVLDAASIGLLPFNDNQANVSRSPMKYFEYLAAGLWVLARSTATLRGRQNTGVFQYSSPREAVDQLDCALKQAPRRNLDGRSEARGFGWDHRAAELIRFAEHLALRS